MRYCASMLLNGLQNCKRSKLEIQKKASFWAFNFDRQWFCSPVSHKSKQYLIPVSMEKSHNFLNGVVFSQACSSTFKVWYLHSKYPDLRSAYLVGVCRLLFLTLQPKLLSLLHKFLATSAFLCLTTWTRDWRSTENLPKCTQRQLLLL